MASPNVDALFPRLLPWLPNCPYDLVRGAVKRAAGRFCRDSNAWRVRLSPITIVDADNSYPIALATDLELVDILNVYTSSPAGGQLDPVTQEKLDRVLPNWQSATGQPAWFNCLDFANLTVYPIPANTIAGTTYTMRVAQSPLGTIADLDTFLTVRYAEALVSGAFAELVAMKDEAWSRDEREVKRHLEDFLRRIDLAKIETLHERVMGELYVVPRRFGRA